MCFIVAEPTVGQVAFIVILFACWSELKLNVDVSLVADDGRSEMEDEYCWYWILVVQMEVEQRLGGGWFGGCSVISFGQVVAARARVGKGNRTTDIKRNSK